MNIPQGTRELEKFNEADLGHVRVLKSVIKEASIPMKGNAVIEVAKTLHWLNLLENKIQDAIKIQALTSAPTIGTIETSKKKRV